MPRQRFSGHGLSGTYKGRMKQKEFEQNLNIIIESFVGTGDKSLMSILGKHLVKAFTAVGELILQDAVAHCPWGEVSRASRVVMTLEESVMLRGSGVASLSVRGGKEHFPLITVEANRDGGFTLIVHSGNIQKYSKQITLDISFDKEVRGMDLALWAHETLRPYVPRPKKPGQKGFWYARHYGTGPKYLENAFNKFYWEAEKTIYQASVNAIEEWKRLNKAVVE